ncbi:hypothetical protein RUM43_013220 [Polyplax serrata]|uniref:Uncharacterized protein n=1 Tax=Polyplax serrata TaxID=468196 RepID=A0AAN8S7A0_POLSC
MNDRVTFDGNERKYHGRYSLEAVDVSDGDGDVHNINNQALIRVGGSDNVKEKTRRSRLSGVQAQARADTFSSRNGFFCVISMETGLISPEDFLRFGMCGLTFLSRLQN